VSGFEVPDFQTMRKSGKVSFDRSAYDLPHNTIQYHTVLHDLWKLFTRATPTAFHTLMDSIASDGRLLRHYTQNINCIEQSLPDLYERTVQLHGGINEVLCQYCGWNGLRISESFSEDSPGVKRWLWIEEPSCAACGGKHTANSEACPARKVERARVNRVKELTSPL